MHLTQPSVAKSALTLAAGLFLAELGLMVLGQLSSPARGSAWSVLESLAWLATLAGLGVAAWKLSTAVARTELPKVLLGLTALLGATGLFWLLLPLAPGGLRGPSSVVSALTSLGSAAYTVGWCLLLGALARPKHGWAVPVAAVVGMLALVRVTFSLVLVFQLLDLLQVLSFSGTAWIRTGLSLVIALGLAALALGAREGLEGASPLIPSAFGAPALTASELLGAPALGPAATAAPAPAGGGRLVLTGAALLIVGLAVTAFSYDAARGGGRYVVATGAMLTGVVQLVRGLTRLGSQS